MNNHNFHWIDSVVGYKLAPTDTKRRSVSPTATSASKPSSNWYAAPRLNRPISVNMIDDKRPCKWTVMKRESQEWSRYRKGLIGAAFVSIANRGSHAASMNPIGKRSVKLPHFSAAECRALYWTKKKKAGVKRFQFARLSQSQNWQTCLLESNWIRRDDTPRSSLAC